MNNNKRYQVFLSSTYNDLKEERQEVISALIKRKCFPIAMEYFPAMNRKSVDYIKDAIKECDFYILIVAGRYGSSRDDNGVGLTEIEFDYAQELKIPTNIYLYDGPPLPSDKIEENEEGKKRLRSFIQKLKATGLGYATWSNKDNLASEVKDGIEELKSSSSAVGWVRANESYVHTGNIQKQDTKATVDYSTLTFSENRVEREMQSNDFTNWLIDSLKALKYKDTEKTNEALQALMAETLQYRDAYLNWLRAMVINKSEVWRDVTKIFERIAGEVPVLDIDDIEPASNMGYYSLFMREIAIYTIAMLFNHRFYKDIYNIMTYEYVISAKVSSRDFHENKGFCDLVYIVPDLPKNMILTSNPKECHSPTAELILMRVKEPEFNKNILLDTDTRICQLSFIYRHIVAGFSKRTWLPCTIAHYTRYFNDGATYLWKDMKKKSVCEEMLPLFGVDNISELKEVIVKNPVDYNRGTHMIDFFEYHNITDSVKIEEIASQK